MSMALYEATRKFQERQVVCSRCGNRLSTDEHIMRCLFEAGTSPVRSAGRVS